MKHGLAVVVALATLTGCTTSGGDTDPSIPISTPGGDTRLSEVLCDLLEPAEAEDQLSAVADQAVSGPLEATPLPAESLFGEASTVASCVLATQSREPFAITGCTTGVSQLNAFIKDFSFGPYVDGFESDETYVEVRGSTAAEFRQQAFAASPNLGGQPWEPVAGGSFDPNVLTLQRVIERNNQLLYVHVGGLDRDPEPAGCGAVRDLLIKVSDRIIAAADRLKTS